jgi:hypothetical protein
MIYMPVLKLAVGDCLRLLVVKTNGESRTFYATNTLAAARPDSIMQPLADQVNKAPELQGPDGIEILSPFGTLKFGFPVRARSPGAAPSLIRVALSACTSNSTFPAADTRLDFNLGDTQARAHVYVTAGATNLAAVFALDTTRLLDGFHQITAVAYEGSHVRTQTQISQLIVVSNSPLAASLSSSLSGTNAPVGTQLGFSVSANKGPISTTELFSTGGSLGIVAAQAVATFSVAGATLGVGRHPFWGIVTPPNGRAYKTDTKWIRLTAQ